MKTHFIRPFNSMKENQYVTYAFLAFLSLGESLTWWGHTPTPISLVWADWVIYWKVLPFKTYGLACALELHGIQIQMLLYCSWVPGGDLSAASEGTFSVKCLLIKKQGISSGPPLIRPRRSSCLLISCFSLWHLVPQGLLFKDTHTKHINNFTRHVMVYSYIYCAL